MKKQLIISVFAILLLAAVVAGSTYAFFRTTLGSDNDIVGNTSIMNIIYSGGEEFDDTMRMVATREEGYSTNINIRTTSASVTPTIDLFLQIEDISQNIAVAGFKWEACAERSGDTTVCNQGNFAGYNTTDHSVVTMFQDYQLNSTNTKFTVYLWLDGNLLGDEITGSSFQGYIGAKSEQFTAKFT